MIYEINVALNKLHLFATHSRSITNSEELKKVLVLFDEKFPESEGFHVSATATNSTGFTLDKNADINEQINGIYKNG